MVKFRLISEDIVGRNKIHEEFNAKIDLTLWDLNLLGGPIQKGLFFPKPTPFQLQELFPNNLIDHLKSSLSHTLEFFKPLTGRLRRVIHDDKTSSFFIDCNNEGANFTHAVVEGVTIQDILKPTYTPEIIHSFFPLNGMLNFEGTSKPLLAIQVNELVDGFFICCTMNHMVGDGSCFWHFLNSWAEISRGNEKISKVPTFTRWFPSDMDIPIRVPFSPLSKTIDKFVQTRLAERVFHFSKLKIMALKEKAKVGTTDTKISSLQAIFAHLWKSIIRCQKVGFEHEVRFMLAVSSRLRLKPSIPDSYFGNTVNSASVTANAEEILKECMAVTASRMHHAIDLKTSDNIIQNLKYFVNNPTLITMSHIPKNAVITSSSQHYNMYGTDFGWGKPLAVRSGSSNKFDGTITVYPGVDEGSIDIEVCLLREKLIALGNDKEFMEAVGVDLKINYDI